MKKFSLGALVAAGLLVGGLSAGSASAADLGGNCCADLEERIAELEATTARKGNRKVSLTISGWVAEQVTWFDDGVEQNVYVSGIGRTLQSHFKFTGQATVTPGWYAGYVIHIEVGTVDSFGISGATDDPADNINQPFVGIRDTDRGVYALQSFWFVKSDTMGKLSVGKQSQASDNTAILVDGSGSLVPANWVLFDGASFAVNRNGVSTGLTWNLFNWCATINDGIGGDCNGLTTNAVRYDSPTFGGFSVSASWGEDDMWDVAARYAGEWNGIKLAAAVAYSQVTDENLAINDTNNALLFGNVVKHKDVDYFQAGLYVEHVPTGLFGYAAYGKENNDSIYQACEPSTANVAVSCFSQNPPGGLTGAEFGGSDQETFYFKAGLRERWTPLGHTVLYGEYGWTNDGIFPGLADPTFGVTDSKMERYGLGVVQEIDAAAMSVWLSWRHHQADFTCSDTSASSETCFSSFGGFGEVDVDDVEIIKAGALINF